jgi:uncharacterized phiE125 gp8 family phage protein
MYTIEVVTPPESEPVTLNELKAHLRLNDDSEDALLTGFIKAAREVFESYTGRIVLPTTLRQHVPYFNSRVYLMRSQARSIVSVKYWDASNVLTTLEDFHSDVITCPGSVWLDSYPVTSSTKSPKAYVEFEAGWEPEQVPEMVKVGIKLLAAHYYEQRNSHSPEDLKTVPMGFKAVCEQFKTGLMGPFGMGA